MEADCFALLGVARGLILDENALKDHYHAAVARGENAETLNQAYAILRSPARRIDHLLGLFGKSSAAEKSPGSSLFDLFLSVNAALTSADGIIHSLHTAPSALQRAALADGLIHCLGDLTDTLGNVHQQKSLRQEQLAVLHSKFPNLEESEWTFLTLLAADFSFLTKWESEIRKRETRLQEMLIGQMT